MNGVFLLALSGSLAALLGAAPAEAQRAPGATAAAAERQSVAARAAALFQKGNELYIEERWAEAEAAYKEAWELRKAFDIAAHLGHTELRLGKPRDAATHLSYALRNWPLMANPKQREIAERRLAEARRQVGALEVRVSAAGAKVSLDGSLVGAAPIEHELYVEPGAHTILVTLDGYEPASRRAVFVAGNTNVVEVDLRRVSAPISKEKEDAGKSKLVLIGGAGLSVALLGAGTGLLVASQGKRDDWESARAELPGSDKDATMCEPKDRANREAACTKIEDAKSDNRTFAYIATPLLTAGGAIGVATLVYAIWPSSRPEPRSGVRVRPVITASDGGVQVMGRF